MRVSPRLLPLTAALLAAALVLSGCSGKDDEPKEPVAGESPAPSSATPTPTPTPSPTPTPTPSEPAALADTLLPAGRVAGLNESWTWVEDETVKADPDPIGYCDRFDVYTLGATEALHRTYGAPAGADPELNRASELVAEFPDETTATRAFAVLRSWHRGCAQRINPDLKAELGPLNRVDADGARALWFLVTVPEFDMDPGSFSAFGFVRVGSRIAIATMDSGGPDYNYPRGQEPMVGTLRAAAAALR